MSRILTSQIPRSVYRKVLGFVPICCVDLLIHIGGRFLLFKRKNVPAKGEWWLPGGRIWRGEKIEDAVLRKAKEETGMDVKVERLIGVYETFWRKGYFGVRDVHTINLCFLVTPLNGKFEVKLDEQHSSFKVFDKKDGNWHPYLVKAIEDSGILGATVK